MIMDWMRKQKGSISIFLCLILMPMVTFATMIIDASRLQAAKTAISGAGDLTLNAAMSEYEQLLKDMYGLFAGIQNESDLEPALEAYFTRTIEGKIGDGPVSQGQVQSWAQSITDFVLQPKEDGSYDFGNLLNMEVDSFELCNVSSSSIANPAVMKRQIIEYMKYKGPVSLASTLINKLNFLKGSDKQVQAVEDKVEYVTKMGEVEEACKEAWDALNEYNEAAKKYNDKNLSPDLSDPSKNSKLADDFNKVNSLCYTACLASLYAQNLPLAGSIRDNMQAYPIIISDTEYNKNYEQLSAMDTASLYTFLGNLEGKLNDLVDIGSGEDSQIETILKQGYSSGNIELKNFDYDNQSAASVSYPAMVSVMEDTLDMIKNRVSDAVASSKTDDLANSMMKKFTAQWRFGDPNAPYKNMISVVYGACKEYKKYLEIYCQGVEIYQGRSDIDSTQATEMIHQAAKMTIVKDYLASNDGPKGLLDSINSVCFKYKDYDDVFDLCIKQIEKLLNPYHDQIEELDTKIGKVNTKIENILTVMDEMEQKKDEWQESIEAMPDGATKVASQSDYDTTTDAIERDAVDDFKDVVTELQKIVTAHVNTIESIKFMDKSIVVDGLSDIRSTCNTNTSNALEMTFLLGVPSSELDSVSLPRWEAMNGDEREPYITFAALYAKNAKLIWKQPPSSNLSDVENLVDCPHADVAMYVVDDYATVYTLSIPYTLRTMIHLGLLDGFVDNPNDESGTAYEKERFHTSLKGICEAITSDVSTENQDAVNEANNIGGGGEGYSGPSDADGGDGGGGDDGDANDDNGSSSLGDILSDISDYCRQEALNQDVSESATSDTSAMAGFSVDTGKDDYVDDGKKSAGMLSSAKGVLSSIVNIGESVARSAYLEEYFTEMFSCDTDRLSINDNKALTTLSGVTLKSDTAWYGKEVEFILWGKSDLSANVAANYAMIYLIRFALNAIYAFTAPDIQSFALEVATAIAGWTVIGVPIVQAVITIGLALAESGVDIYKLRQGEPVAIYKNQTTFVCSPTGLVSGIGKEAIESATKAAVSEIENQINQVIDDVAGDVTATVGDKLGALEDALEEYVNQQVDSITSGIENMYITPLINQITPILSQVNNAAGNVEQAVTDAVEDAFDSVASNIATMPSGIMHEVADFVTANIIEGAKNNLITGISTTIEEAVDTVSPESIKNVIFTEIDGWTRRIQTNATEKLEAWQTELTDYLNENTDKAVAEVKGYISEQLGTLSDYITGAVTGAVQNAASAAAGSVSDMMDSSAGAGGFTLDYKEYCKIFVFMHVIGDEEKMLHRAAALVEANIGVGCEGKNGISGFKARNAYSMFFVESNIRMKTLFPWAADVSMNEIMQEDGMSFNMAGLTRDGLKVHYSGINGY